MNLGQLERGSGRTALKLTYEKIGKDYLVKMSNGIAHIGAVAIGQFSREEGRASSSVLTLPGHRDDRIAKEAAERLSKETGSVSVVVVGIHLDDILPEEIEAVMANSQGLIEDLLERIR